jgi:hypothetical protein
MKRERRQPIPREWQRVTSSRPVVRRIPPEKKPGEERVRKEER